MHFKEPQMHARPCATSLERGALGDQPVPLKHALFVCVKCISHMVAYDWKMPHHAVPLSIVLEGHNADNDDYHDGNGDAKCQPEDK